MRRTLLLSLLALPLSAQGPVVEIDSPMTPPDWALMERALLDANSRAVEAFADRYIDERGYLLHTIRWGTLDGPDDAIETYYNWTLLHALGGSDSVLELYKKGLEGHLLLVGQLALGGDGDLAHLGQRGQHLLVEVGHLVHSREHQILESAHV